jgi:hypothetical protein
MLLQTGRNSLWLWVPASGTREPRLGRRAAHLRPDGREPGRSCPRGRRGDRKRAGRQLRWSSRRGPGQRRRRHRRLRRLRRRVGRCGRRGRGGTGGEGQQQQQHRGPLHRFPPARCEAPPGRTVSAKPLRGAGSSRASSPGVQGLQHSQNLGQRRLRALLSDLDVAEATDEPGRDARGDDSEQGDADQHQGAADQAPGSGRGVAIAVADGGDPW